MKLKWTRRCRDDPNTILCIYDDNDRSVFLDLSQIDELYQFIKER